MRKLKLTMILSWYYILAFFVLFGLISYFYRSFRIKEGNENNNGNNVTYLNNKRDDEEIKTEYENLASCSDLYIIDYVLNGSCNRENGGFCPSNPYNIKNCPGKDITNCDGVFVCGNCKGQSAPCTPPPNAVRNSYMYVYTQEDCNSDTYKGTWEDSICYVK